MTESLFFSQTQCEKIKAEQAYIVAENQKTASFSIYIQRSLRAIKTQLKEP